MYKTFSLLWWEQSKVFFAFELNQVLQDKRSCHLHFPEVFVVIYLNINCFLVGQVICFFSKHYLCVFESHFCHHTTVDYWVTYLSIPNKFYITVNIDCLIPHIYQFYNLRLSQTVEKPIIPATSLITVLLGTVKKWYPERLFFTIIAMNNCRQYSKEWSARLVKSNTKTLKSPIFSSFY